MGSILERLADAVTEALPPIACGGRQRLAGGLAIRFAGAESIELLTSKGVPSKRGLSTLMARMTPAPFGAGRETRIDRDIRHALQLSARDQPFEVVGFDPSEVLEATRLALLPDEPARLVAELLSINVYGVDGHFVRHKDTPRGDRMFGSLVVCVPFPFQGGELALEQGATEAVFDFASDIAAEPGALAWAAFFADVDHQITNVSRGHRVTLSYALRLGKSKAPAKPARSPASDGFYALFAEAARDPALCDGGAVLRIPCLHQYETAAGAPSVRNVDMELLRDLKGRDRDVARAALSASRAVELVHCLAIVGEDEGEEFVSVRLERAPSRKEIARIRSKLHEATLEDVEQELEAANGPPFVVHLLGSWESGVQIGAELFSPTGYYGNEASNAIFYVASVMDIVVQSTRVAVVRRVRHKKFGAGVVLDSSAQGGETSLRVRFDDGEERTILERFLEAVGG